MSVNSVHEAAKFLREGIREGKFAPGQRLIARDVSALAGGGVGSYREALVRLAGEGLVTLHPNRGASVRKLDTKDVREIYLMLDALEPVAARLCAQHARRHEIDTAGLQTSASALNQACRSGRVSAFHAARYALLGFLRKESKAARLYEVAAPLSLQISKRENDSQLSKTAISISNEELQDIVSHILDGKAAKAERMMRSHIKRIGKAVLANMRADGRTI